MKFAPVSLLFTLALLFGALACIDTRPLRQPTETAGTVTTTISPQVDIRLGAHITPFELSLQSDWVASSTAGAILDRGAGPIRFEAEAGLLRINGKQTGHNEVQLNPGSGAFLQYGGKAYRGGFIVTALHTSKTIVFHNRLGLESYLLAVVPSEMPVRFGLEALKAQAVAARSYALAAMKTRGWLYSDTRSQAYGGVHAESPLAARAVLETEGQTLEINGATLSAWYHSTCGGVTAASQSLADAYGSEILAGGVRCPDCRGSPYYRWTRRISMDLIQQALKMTEPPLQALVSARSPTGHVQRLYLKTKDGGREVTAENFRRSVSRGHPIASQVLSLSWVPDPKHDGDGILVEGRGWGHGVGMCQYGAGGFATRGADYHAILRRYYPEAQLRLIP